MALIRQISRRAVVLQNTEAEVATSKTVTPYYEWVFNGELNFPVETALDTLHHTDSENTIYQVRITAREAGNSTYRFKIISYDLDGDNPITHVDEPIQFTDDRRTAPLTIADALLPADRTLEARIFEEVVDTTPAKDVTISVTLGALVEVQPLSTEYLIQREDDTILPKRSFLQFLNATIEDDLPNDRTIIDVHPVGAYMEADLTEAQFQDQMGDGWILADGRDVTGSKYHAITGKTECPDRRATYGRMKDNGRGLDPTGDPDLGDFQDHALEDHHHEYNETVTNNSRAQDNNPTRSGFAISDTSGVLGANVDPSETRPKTTIVNVFIKVN